MAYWKLDCDELRKTLLDKELKRWWVAEFSGVHKTTLRRWLSGNIHRLREGHITELARLLEVPVFSLGEPLRKKPLKPL